MSTGAFGLDPSQTLAASQGADKWGKMPSGRVSSPHTCTQTGSPPPLHLSSQFSLRRLLVQGTQSRPWAGIQSLRVTPQVVSKAPTSTQKRTIFGYLSKEILFLKMSTIALLSDLG